MTRPFVVLGSGMAGCGAAHALSEAGHRAAIFDNHSYHGGHTASFKYDGGWIFDDGPHISFSRVDRMKDLLAESVNQEYETIQAYVNNYWSGHWIKHPAAANLHGLPTELLVKILNEFSNLDRNDTTPPANYAEWLVKAYGPTFAETFPMAYGKKYHTVDASNMTTEWLGERLYQPSFEEALRGALSPETPHVHYISHFRYPTRGGFVSYLGSFLEKGDLHLNHEAIAIDPVAKSVEFANGTVVEYGELISSIPLPSVVKLIKGCPAEVLEAASRLGWTRCVMVNIGLSRNNFSKAHWSYFYDEDFAITRTHCPHLLSPNVVPEGMGSIQCELYFSDKYRPLDITPEECIPLAIRDLKRCGIIQEGEPILMTHAYLTPWAQIIFDLERAAALEVIHGYLQDIGIRYCGRYGEWGYQWTDESFMSGEKAASIALKHV